MRATHRSSLRPSAGSCGRCFPSGLLLRALSRRNWSRPAPRRKACKRSGCSAVGHGEHRLDHGWRRDDRRAWRWGWRRADQRRWRVAEQVQSSGITEPDAGGASTTGTAHRCRRTEVVLFAGHVVRHGRRRHGGGAEEVEQVRQGVHRRGALKLRRNYWGRQAERSPRPHQCFKAVRRFTGKRLAIGDLNVEVDTRLNLVIADADQLAILQQLAITRRMRTPALTNSTPFVLLSVK